MSEPGGEQGMRIGKAFLAAALCFVAGLPAAAQESGRYLGVATCAGSTCHGRAEGNGAPGDKDKAADEQEEQVVAEGDGGTDGTKAEEASKK